jgi:O-antigen ligase
LCVGYLFLSTRSITWSTALVAIAILLGLWASTQFVERQSYTISRIQLLFDSSEDERTRTSQRSVLAAAGWQIFLENPAGIGTGGFREEAANTNLVRGRRPAHSAWIKTLAENGVLGIILMTAFIGSYAVIGFRKRHEGKLLFGLFITILFAGAFVAKEFRGKSLWFLAAGGIVLMHPELMLHYLKKKSKPVDVDSRTRLREVRFGRRK